MLEPPAAKVLKDRLVANAGRRALRCARWWGAATHPPQALRDRRVLVDWPGPVMRMAVCISLASRPSQPHGAEGNDVRSHIPGISTCGRAGQGPEVGVRLKVLEAKTRSRSERYRTAMQDRQTQNCQYHDYSSGGAWKANVVWVWMYVVCVETFDTYVHASRSHVGSSTCCDVLGTLVVCDVDNRVRTPAPAPKELSDCPPRYSGSVAGLAKPSMRSAA